MSTETPARTLTVPALFDAHVHFREAHDLARYVPPTARSCDYAVVMPNLDTPVTTADQVLTYRAAIERATRIGFTPLLTLYLTRELRAADVAEAKRLAGAALVGVKLYPAGATTGSSHGIPLSWLRDGCTAAPPHFMDTLREIANQDLVLLVHGEDPDADLTDRELFFTHTHFLDHYLECHPEARATLEHVSTLHGVKWVTRLRQCGYDVRGTITLHHLYLSLTETYGQVFNCCWPAPRFAIDRTILGELALGRHADADAFFLGSDSAPHQIQAKYQPRCACGCYTAPTLVERLAEFFAPLGAGAEAAMTAFTSTRACAFYRQPPPRRTLRLVRGETPWTVPEYLTTTDATRLWDAGRAVHFYLDLSPALG